MSVSFITDRYFSFWRTCLKSAYVLNFPWFVSLHWAKLYARISLKRFTSFVFTSYEKFCWYAILVETPNGFNKKFTQETQRTLSWPAILQLSLYAHCNNSELVVNNLWKYLHVFTKTLTFKGHVPNSLITAVLHDFLPIILDMYFKNLICNLSRKKFSSKFSNLKSAFLIFGDKIFTVPQRTSDGRRYMNAYGFGKK